MRDLLDLLRTKVVSLAFLLQITAAPTLFLVLNSLKHVESALLMAQLGDRQV